MSHAAKVLPPGKAYRLWAATYDDDPNPILALEERYLAPNLPNVEGRSVLDIGCGTGRWLRYFNSYRVQSLQGVDSSAEMLDIAKAIVPSHVRLHHSDATMLPIPDETIDFALGSFLLSYLPDHVAFFEELYRVLCPGGTAIVTDLHPVSRARGWKSGFHVGNASIEIETHCYTFIDLQIAAIAAGLNFQLLAQPHFGQQEELIFQRANREDLYGKAREHSAIYIALLSKNEGAETNSTKKGTRSWLS